MSVARLVSSQQVRASAQELLAACRGCCSGAALRSAYLSILDEEVPEPIQRTLEGLGRNPSQSRTGGGGR